MAATSARHARLDPQRLGSLIAAVFGLVYVMANSGPLPQGVALTLQVVAVLVFLALVVAIVRRRSFALPDESARGGFKRGYWAVVGTEVVAIAAGIALLNGPLGAPYVSVAWISLVVGLHFFALARVWHEPLFGCLGGPIALCGLVGLAAAAFGASAALIAVAAGMVPAALLFAFSALGATVRGPRARSGSAPPVQGSA
jgi:hypothetical protein